ncbi:MAG: hypothetical protein L0H63_11750 [Nitrococcus sp.]|nr:hypothetical protein [Nitrococcus sp.]
MGQRSTETTEDAEMMYTIKNNGTVLGHFPGADETSALDAFALWCGGFGSFDQAMKETGEDPSAITVEPAPAGAKAYTDASGKDL